MRVSLKEWSAPFEWSTIQAEDAWRQGVTDKHSLNYYIQYPLPASLGQHLNETPDDGEQEITQ